VGQGIVEEQASDTLITRNVINPVPLGVPYLTTVAIASTNSSNSTQIINNEINFSGLGIVLNDPYNEAIVRDNDMDVALIGISLGQADDAIVAGNGISAFGAGIVMANSPGASISDNGIALHGVGTGIGVAFSDEAAVSSNDIISPAVGIRITGTEAIVVQGNIINDPANTGIVLNEDRRGLVDSNQIVDSLLGIHYRSGTLANISDNTVTSLAGGVGIRLGTGAAGCPVNVEIVTVQDNVLTGGATGVEVLCDVGAHTLINN
jgi:nitrous oxidase accessory protein NosD